MGAARINFIVIAFLPRLILRRSEPLAERPYSPNAACNRPELLLVSEKKITEIVKGSDADQWVSSTD
jgi:hypothetical protein